MDKPQLCDLCAQCPFSHMRPLTYMDLGGQGHTALAAAVVSNAYRDLLLCDREPRRAALDWLFSRDGEDLLSMLDIEINGALRQALLMFRCGEKRAGLFARGS